MLSLRRLSQERRQIGDVDRLDEVPVESGLAPEPPLLVAAPAAQRDEKQVFPLRRRSGRARHLIAVHAWHAEVDDGEVRLVLL